MTEKMEASGHTRPVAPNTAWTEGMLLEIPQIHSQALIQISLGLDQGSLPYHCHLE